MAFRVSLLLAALGSVHATKLMVVNASNVIGGGRSGQLLEVDLESKATRTIVEGLESELEWIRPSVTCGTKWYSLPTLFPEGAYLATVDLANSTYEGKRPLDFLPFALKCGKSENELLTVAGSGSPPQFSLMKLDLSGDTLATETIGTFPDVLWGGWLSIFHFSDTELQAAFPVKSKAKAAAKGGEVYRMDIETGEITFHKKVKSCMGCPSVPYHLQHTGGDAKGHGVFATEEGQATLSFCEVDYSGSEVKVSKCKKDADKSWWAIGRPPVQCPRDKLNYFGSIGFRTASYEPILGADMDSGDLIDAVHLSGDYAGDEHENYVGSMTCSSSAVVSLV